MEGEIGIDEEHGINALYRAHSTQKKSSPSILNHLANRLDFYSLLTVMESKTEKLGRYWKEYEEFYKLSSVIRDNLISDKENIQ